MLATREKFIFREAGEHRAIVESLVDKTLELKKKLNPEDHRRSSFIQLIKPEPGNISTRRGTVIHASKKAKSPSFKSSGSSSDNEEVDTSVESAPESHKVNLSRFIDKKEHVDLYKHETSFRRKTNHLITTALDREKTGKDKVDALLPQIGNFMSKAAIKLDFISRMTVGVPLTDLTSKMARETSQTSDRTQRKTFVLSTPS